MRPADVVLQRPLAAVHHLRPGADEVGVVDVDLRLLEVAGPELAHPGLEVLGGGRGAAGKGIDLADLARPAGGGRGGQKEALDLIARLGLPAQQQHGNADHEQNGDGGEQPSQRGFRGARCEGALQVAQQRLEPGHPKFPQLTRRCSDQSAGPHGPAHKKPALDGSRLGAPTPTFKNLVAPQLVLRKRWLSRHAQAMRWAQGCMGDASWHFGHASTQSLCSSSCSAKRHSPSSRRSGYRGRRVGGWHGKAA